MMYTLFDIKIRLHASNYTKRSINMTLTLQIHDTDKGWLDAAELRFTSPTKVQIEYDIDYATDHINRTDLFALSVNFPVGFKPFKGDIPGYLIDLIPQGNVLKRLLGRFGILNEYQYEQILTEVPLASPGNVRIKEAWDEIERRRPDYNHLGFERRDIISARTDFVTYMEEHGAPIGGTSGAAGGAPKFLLREDDNGKFHADGYLDDAKTKRAWLVKFPFTDSDNSKLLLQTEMHYYNVLRDLGLDTHESLEWHDDILFIPRFDRIKEDNGTLRYYGLESFYSVHGINTQGVPLSHEDNIKMILRYSSTPTTDVLEYWLRDIANQALCNLDNHGRNTSLLKGNQSTRLSPVYDVTAMKFFKNEIITPLTRWDLTRSTIKHQLQWLLTQKGIDIPSFTSRWNTFTKQILELPKLLQKNSVPKEIIQLSEPDRREIINQIQAL